MVKKEELMKGFYKLTQQQRLDRVQKFCHLTDQEVKTLSGEEALPVELAENFIENVIGYFQIPFGVATYFNIDGRDLLIPMAVEETSIIAAASATAKWIKKEGNITTYSKGKVIIGQIQLPTVRNIKITKEILHKNRKTLIDLANDCVPGLVARGGGVQDIAFREIERSECENERMLIVHVLCDPCDAMGANLINQICESLKPVIERLTGERVGLCILSNLVDGRLSGAEVIIRNVDPQIGRGIEEASIFAKSDPYRATTHNKGTLNGIDPVLIATGNDWRAVEAGIHAYAARSGKYQPITDWKMEGPDLVGRLEAPFSVGIVGGVTSSHPVSQVALKMLKVKSARDLARVCAAVGLVQNLGALKALSTVGIVKGHMNLHTANLAIAAGAKVHEIRSVKQRLSEILKTEKKINLTHAKKILEDFRVQNSTLQ